MGELVFVGVGLHDELGISLRGLEALRAAPKAFAEEYTAGLAPGWQSRLSSLSGTPVETLSREEVEGETRILQALATERTVVFLVPGDAFAATTHLSLRLAAEKAGHSTRVVHGASIITAAPGLVGLFQYKFGRVVSLPYPEEGSPYRPLSPYRALQANDAAGMHSLILLDLDPRAGRFLTADVALRHLGRLEEELHEGVAPADREFAVVARAGGPDVGVWVGTRAQLEHREFGPPLHSLILPAPASSRHFMEEEALAELRKRISEKV